MKTYRMFVLMLTFIGFTCVSCDTCVDCACSGGQTVQICKSKYEGDNDKYEGAIANQETHDCECK